MTVRFLSSIIPVAQASSHWTVELLVDKFIDQVLQPIIALLFVLATVAFFWGVIQYVIAEADQKKVENAKRVIVWGLLGMFLMSSVWGIITILCEFFETCHLLP